MTEQAWPGGHLELAGGFWSPIVLGDCDEDGGVTVFDFGEFSACSSGPGSAASPPCSCADMDNDGDVDSFDFAAIQIAFTGRLGG